MPSDYHCNDCGIAVDSIPGLSLCGICGGQNIKRIYGVYDPEAEAENKYVQAEVFD